MLVIIITIMPRQKVYAVHGGSLRSFLSSINAFLKKHKVISRGANLLGTLGVPYTAPVGAVAEHFGYGARRRTRRYKKKAYGMGALSLPGGAIRRTRRVRHYTMY